MQRSGNLNGLALAALALLATAPAAFAGGAHCDDKKAEASRYEKESVAKKQAAHGWLGIDTERVADGRYAVTEVAAGSPAEKAGFQQGDILLALNGARFGDANKDAVKKAKAGLAPGKAATYTVERAGGERQLTATLVEVPAEVLAKWVDEAKYEEAEKVAKN